MALELEGKLHKVLPEVTGEGKNGTWYKLDFVIETFGEYPKKVALTAWGDAREQVTPHATGTALKIKFSAESREYNERWYTELRAYSITVK